MDKSDGNNSNELDGFINDQEALSENDSSVDEGNDNIEGLNAFIEIPDDWLNNIKYDETDSQVGWGEPLELNQDDASDSAILFQQARDAYTPVDTHILTFISNFVDAQNKTAKQKSLLKTIFFYIIMLIFFLISLTPIVAIVVLYIVRPGNSIGILAAITASIIEVLVSIIVLPQIVAEYLFNKEEDTTNIKIVELMKAYSETMHEYDK